MAEYRINKTTHEVSVDGRMAETAWAKAETLSIERYPWYDAGRKQPTTVRLLYDDRALYLQFQCDDIHSSAKATELNGPVYLDSCVEMFAAPGPDAAGYFNLEANCCGTFHMGFGAGRSGRKLISAELARGVTVVGSEPSPTKQESPQDEHWWLAAKLSFDVLSEFTGLEIQPHAGDIWRANFYRCGGKTDDQYACWNPISVAKPDFHRPECFGELHFA